MDQFAIGVDIGGTRTKLGLVNIKTGEVLYEIVHATEKESEGPFLQQIYRSIHEFGMLLADAKASLDGIGFGIPGFVDEHGVVDTTYGFLRFMENYPLKSKIEADTGIACRLDNDARVVALGEALFGSGRNHSRVLALTLGTGLGVGFVVNGIFPDPLPFSHMSGHMSIGDKGERCYCGKTGCLEAQVSSAAIFNAKHLTRLASSGGALPDPQQVFTLARDGNPFAAEIVNGIIEALQKGIHNFINIYAPDIIVIGGGMSRSLKEHIKELNQINYLSPYRNYTCEVRISDLQEQAGILGAAALFSNRNNSNSNNEKD
ncbi:MAG TPA: ROK family protein [Flavitalea sp.]|nr:ROK family protein [Flavitalea sp.]